MRNLQLSEIVYEVIQHYLEFWGLFIFTKSSLAFQPCHPCYQYYKRSLIHLNFPLVHSLLVDGDWTLRFLCLTSISLFIRGCSYQHLPLFAENHPSLKPPTPTSSISRNYTIYHRIGMLVKYVCIYYSPLNHSPPSSTASSSSSSFHSSSSYYFFSSTIAIKSWYFIEWVLRAASCLLRSPSLF